MELTLKKKKCKNCGTLFQPNKPLQYICNWHCATDYAKKLNDKKEAKEWKEKKAIKKKELMTLQDWIKIAQTHFNHFIRLRDKNKECISCGKLLRPNNTDAGHMWSAGGHYNLRFNEFNVNGQCSRPCNKDKSGDINNYRLGFINRYGKYKLIELDLMAHVERKYTIDEVKQIAETYKKKCKELNK